MRILRYKSDLPPDSLLERLNRFPARDIHYPLNFFDSYEDPRVGLHTYPTGKGVKGYYEDGSRGKGGSLRTMKVWFSVKIKPHGEGSQVSCVIYSSPYAILLFLLMFFFSVSQSFTDPMGACIPFAFSLFFLFLENVGQNDVCGAIRTLVPKTKK